MNGRERTRIPQAGDTPPLRDPRRGGDGQNGALDSPADSPMSRAEKFEDEKRRIIHHCFGKKDKDTACTWVFLFLGLSSALITVFAAAKTTSSGRTCRDDTIAWVSDISYISSRYKEFEIVYLEFGPLTVFIL